VSELDHAGLGGFLLSRRFIESSFRSFTLAVLAVKVCYRVAVRNVEFKAELKDLPLARTICRALGATSISTMQQTDTYYKLPAGRLKKREIDGEPTEYIFYQRPDKTQPKISDFKIYSENEAITRFGATALPVWLVVKKIRELWMLGNVRIHLDTVETLGTFLEFEALVSPQNDVERCRAVVAELREQFRPALGEPVSVGYSDLLAG
jgi:predicted adenylyl cyclase CyaB